MKTAQELKELSLKNYQNRLKLYVEDLQPNIQTGINKAVEEGLTKLNIEIYKFNAHDVCKLIAGFFKEKGYYIAVESDIFITIDWSGLQNNSFEIVETTDDSHEWIGLMIFVIFVIVVGSLVPYLTWR